MDGSRAAWEFGALLVWSRHSRKEFLVFFFFSVFFFKIPNSHSLAYLIACDRASRKKRKEPLLSTYPLFSPQIPKTPEGHQCQRYTGNSKRYTRRLWFLSRFAKYDAANFGTGIWYRNLVPCRGRWSRFLFFLRAMMSIIGHFAYFSSHAKKSAKDAFLSTTIISQ